MSEMSEYPGGSKHGDDRRAAQVYEHLKSKDTEQLTDELAVLMDKAAQGDCDLELLNTYLKVLDEKDPFPFEIDPEEALERFLDKHAPLLQETGRKQHNSIPHASEVNEFHPAENRSQFRLRKPIVIAAAVILLMASLITAQAFGFDIFGTLFARWSSNTFRFQDSSIPYATIAANPLGPGESAEYESLQEAIDAFGISAPIAPKMLPDRFSFVGANAVNREDSIMIYADYMTEDGFLYIRYNQVDSENGASLEREDKRNVLYHFGGIDHYIYTDLNRLICSWQCGEFECSVMGSVSEQEMRDIIDSIYKELE